MLVFTMGIGTRLQATTPDSKENSKTFIQSDNDVGMIEMYVVIMDEIQQLGNSFENYQGKEKRKELKTAIYKKRGCSIFETKQPYRRSRDGLRKLYNSYFKRIVKMI